MLSSSPALTKQQEETDSRQAAEGQDGSLDSAWGSDWPGLWEWEPLMPRDKPQGGRVKEREGVWEEMEGVVCFGTLGPQAGDTGEEVFQGM